MTVKLLIAIINALSLFALACCISIQIPTFDLNFYKKEYVKLNTAEEMKIHDDELLRVTGELLNYIKGTRSDLNVQAVVDGVKRDFFNQREIDHMEDVKVLFMKGFLARNISAIIFVLTAMFFFVNRRNKPDILPRAYILVFLGFISIMLVVGFIISTDFDRYFTIFHEIFFSNDLWILNPETDLLINLVPLQFFIDITKYIARTFAQSVALVLFCSYVYLKFFKDSLST